MTQRSSARATITDVAKLAGVSISTVSRVVNDTQVVDPELARRVQTAVSQLNYRPNAAASQLKSRRTQTIGLILPEIGGTYFAEMLRSIEGTVTHNGFSLLIYSTHGQDKEQTETGLPVGSHNTDGLLIFADSVSDKEIIQLHKQGFPQVLLHRSPPENINIPMVTIENKSGAYQMVSHLIEQHDCQKIAFLSGPKEHEDASWREQGYRQALADHGLIFDPALVAPGDFDDETAKTAVLSWLTAGVELDAIFAGDDTAAFGAISALNQMGKKIPDDIVVVGFDDLPLSQYVSPALTTVHAPITATGRLAVEKLLCLIQSKPVNQTTLLPTELIIRRSCGC